MNELSRMVEEIEEVVRQTSRFIGKDALNLIIVLVPKLELHCH
jgi:hypothetical protein